ncbi:hypothetical protein D3C71_1396690 [compost metagenome]
MVSDLANGRDFGVGAKTCLALIENPDSGLTADPEGPTIILQKSDYLRTRSFNVLIRDQKTFEAMTGGIKKIEPATMCTNPNITRPVLVNDFHQIRAQTGKVSSFYFIGTELAALLIKIIQPSTFGSYPKIFILVGNDRTDYIMTNPGQLFIVLKGLEISCMCVGHINSTIISSNP